MKRLVFDLDNTITIEGPEPYDKKKPNLALIEKINTYKKLGFIIAIHTARNMKTFEGNIGKINANTLPVIMKWLENNNVPYDEIIVGKPWCGEDGFYVDDRAIRPNEFVELDFEEISKLLSSKGSAK